MDLKHRLISFCCSPRRVLASAGLALAVASSMAGAADYPRVGLVLGGGGARGAAHIGILEVLKEHNVPIACVSGTSMGGLVSGAFAAGLTPEEMLTALDAANWRDMFIDKPEASQISARNKTVARVYLPGSEAGLTEAPGQGAGVVAQVGFGPSAPESPCARPRSSPTAPAPANWPRKRATKKRRGSTLKKRQPSWPDWTRR